MSKSPEQFVHDVLAGGLGVRHVVVGFDFRFGHRRAGDADLLAALGREYGFGVTLIEPVAWRGEVCSSSRIRAAIIRGDVALARDLLGHPFLVEGRVVEGDRRGRELGYPTANVRPARRGLWPADGIYAVRAAWDKEPSVWHDAVASVGVRPTFGGGARPLRSMCSTATSICTGAGYAAHSSSACAPRRRSPRSRTSSCRWTATVRPRARPSPPPSLRRRHLQETASLRPAA